MPEGDLMELKFRLYDGTDIGPVQYAGASTVQMLKERIFSEWPRDKKMIPKTANDLRLISAGKFLENNRTVEQCRVPFSELPGGVITMHVVVQPSLVKMKTAHPDSPPQPQQQPHGDARSSNFHVLFEQRMEAIEERFTTYLGGNGKEHQSNLPGAISSNSNPP